MRVIRACVDKVDRVLQHIDLFRDVVTGSHEDGVQMLERAVMHDLTMREKNDRVQMLEDTKPGLMDTENHSAHVRDCHLPQHRHDMERRCRVERGGRLVEEQDCRVMDHVDADGDAATLAARQLISDSRACDMRESEIFHSRAHSLELLRHGDGSRKTQPCTVEQSLFDCQHWEQCVVLHHVA